MCTEPSGGAAAIPNAWLVALQQGLPLCARPFEELARETGCEEADLLDALARARTAGLVRRFGAVFDVRRLGYRSALCAAAVPSARLDEAAARLVPLAGVTHCYVREAAEAGAAARAYPNLWFTLSYPADVFAAMADEVSARLAPWPVRLLPATKRYKVDVVFGGATRAREESVSDDAPAPTARDRAIIAALQGDTEAHAAYFAVLAEKLGMKEWDLLSTLELWRRSGRLKRIALLLAHRQAGWTANGMCCWRVPGDTAAAGHLLAARDEVTHCYERPEAPGFPFNVFAMIHARSETSAHAQFASLRAALAASPDVGACPATMLLSTKEYKKTSMTFYAR